MRTTASTLLSCSARREDFLDFVQLKLVRRFNVEVWPAVEAAGRLCRGSRSSKLADSASQTLVPADAKPGALRRSRTRKKDSRKATCDATKTEVDNVSAPFGQWPVVPAPAAAATLH